MKAIECKPPVKPEIPEGYKSVFLAGSIEMGKAIDWQFKMVEELKDEEIIFFNPRRDNWDSSWKQGKDEPEFRQQVYWELELLEECDTIVMYIDPNTISPVSLIEFGLHAASGKLIMYCPEGYFRKGNVDIVCEMYGVRTVETFEELVEALRED